MARIEDGKGTTLTFGTSTAFVVEKVRINPGGSEVNDIDMTHLGNTALRTSVASALATSTPLTFDGHHDPALVVPIGINQEITVTFPGGATLKVWGYLQSYDPGDLVEGDKMTCTGSITVSNLNASKAETAPVYAPNVAT